MAPEASGPVAPDALDGAGDAAAPARLSQQRAAELALAGVCVCWGGSFIVVKRAFEHTSPMVFSGLRFLCGLLTLLPLYGRQLRREHARGAAIVGLLLFCGFTAQAAGLKRTTPTRSAFITALCIPLTPIFQSALYRRQPRALDLLGAFVAATGTFLLTSGGGGDGDGAGGGSKLNSGDWLTLACAVLFAFHMIALNHWGKGDALPTVAVGQVAITMVLSLALCDVFETAVLQPTAAVFIAIVATGTLCTALAFTVLAWAQTHTSATRAAIICSTESMFAAFFSYVFNGEVLSGVGCVGAVLIVLSIVVGETKLPPAPEWLPPRARALWERARQAQLEVAEPHAAAPPADKAHGEAAAAVPAKPEDIELSERVSLLSSVDAA